MVRGYTKKFFKSDFQTTLNLSHLEGGLYALMVASIENFLFYYAVERGVSATELGLLATMPLAIGALGQYFLPSIVTEKGLGPWVIWTMFLQVLGVLAITMHALIPLPFIFLLFGTILFYLGGMSSSPLWIDWAQNLIPKRNFRYFIARRNSYTWALILFFFVGFALLNKFSGLKLSTVFVIGALARILSGFLQIYIQKSNYVKAREKNIATVKHLVSFKNLDYKKLFFTFNELNSLNINLKKSIVVFLFATAFFKFGVQIAGPYFVDYMVKDMQLDMLSFVILYSIPSLGRALFFKNWSRLSSNHFIFETLSFQILYLAVIPLIWTVSKSLWFLIPMEVIAGAFWGGFEYMSVLFIQNSLGKNSRKFIGMNMALASCFGLLGALVGAKLFQWGFDYHQVMQASFIGRFGVWCLLILLIICFKTDGALGIKPIKNILKKFFKANET